MVMAGWVYRLRATARKAVTASSGPSIWTWAWSLRPQPYSVSSAGSPTSSMPSPDRETIYYIYVLDEPNRRPR